MNYWEALFLQGKKMRELQVYYFSLRKGGGRFGSPEAKKVLAQSKLEELQFDKMVKELHEWWDTSATLSEALDQIPLAELQFDQMRKDMTKWPEKYGGQELHEFGKEDLLAEKVHEFMFSPENADPVQIAFLNDGIIVEKNDGDDDIRI